MKFDNIAYLKRGNSKQQMVYAVLKEEKIFEKLFQYDPILVGTIPISIDIESSDIDIICYFTDKQDFRKSVSDNFKNKQRFTIKEKTDLDSLAIVANFVVNNFQIEIFGQSIPTKQQFAYRHMLVEHNLLNEHGENFRQKIIDLKRQGYKTEPAFGIALGLKGDPYLELLKFEKNDSPNRL